MNANYAVPLPYEPHPLMRLLHWAMLWSPLRDESLGEEAWECLGLPGRYQDQAVAFTQAFILDLPAPVASPMFSVTLQREAGACREECMRIADYLGMERTGPSLPPDHLALACEMLAHGLRQQEQVLSEGLVERYLTPWIDTASRAVPASLQPLLSAFHEDVLAALNSD